MSANSSLRGAGIMGSAIACFEFVVPGTFAVCGTRQNRVRRGGPSDLGERRMELGVLSQSRDEAFRIFNAVEPQNVLATSRVTEPMDTQDEAVR